MPDAGSTSKTPNTASALIRRIGHAQALASLRAILGQHETSDGVLLDSAAWLIITTQ
jgi:hypothetical protein